MSIFHADLLGVGVRTAGSLSSARADTSAWEGRSNVLADKGAARMSWALTQDKRRAFAGPWLPRTRTMGTCHRARTLLRVGLLSLLHIENPSLGLLLFLSYGGGG